MRLPVKNRNRAVFFMIIVFLLISTNGFCSNKHKYTKYKKWNFNISQSYVYDNNILKYSDKYINLFVSELNFGRFHINTYDDFVLYNSFDAAFSINIIKNLMTTVNVNGTYKVFTHNSIKNWGQINIGLKQQINKRAYAKLFYSYLPDYYIRHFRDKDWVEVYGLIPKTFQPFSFTKNSYGLRLKNTFLSNTKVFLTISYMQFYYNHHFTEYDCNNISGDLKINHPVSKYFDIESSYRFTHSNAKGYDQPDESKETSDDADASFYENTFFVSINVKLPRILKIKNNLNIKVSYGNRQYTSTKGIINDPLHTGRNDNNYRLYFLYKIKPLKNLSISAFYNYYKRVTSSDYDINKQYISNEKDYNQFQTGLTVAYKFKL
jgi:hypothetical protein